MVYSQQARQIESLFLAFMYFLFAAAVLAGGASSTTSTSKNIGLNIHTKRNSENLIEILRILCRKRLTGFRVFSLSTNA